MAKILALLIENSYGLFKSQNYDGCYQKDRWLVKAQYLKDLMCKKEEIVIKYIFNNCRQYASQIFNCNEVAYIYHSYANKLFITSLL